MQSNGFYKKRIRRWLVAAALILIFGVSGCGRAKPQESAQVQEQVQEAVLEQVQAVIEGQAQESGQGQETVAVTASDTTLTITCIKAGAADAFILQSGDHVTIIDTGLEKKSDRLMDALESLGVTHVDELIITHFDKDHVGGADHVIDDYEVGKVYTTYQSKDSDDIEAYRAALERKGLTETVVTKEISFNVGDISFTIYPPKATTYVNKISNNSSLVIKVTLGEKSMLFAGDAEEERIQELLSTRGLEATILKIPHHGRIADNSAALIDYVNPEYAIITSGNSETEDQEILDILSEKGVTTYLTREGTVTITMTGDDVTISQ